MFTHSVLVNIMISHSESYATGHNSKLTA